MPRRDRVADANQQVRDLRNKLHQVEQTTILPLRGRIAELELDNRLLTSKLDHAQRMSGLYQKAWASMLDLVQALSAGKLL